MEKRDILTKTLAVAGTALTWFPILVPFLLSLITLFSVHRFRFDYLMPAELFPFGLAGGGCLVWAALRARSHKAIIGWGFGLSAGMLIAGQGLAVMTGLASGERGAAGWRWFLVLGSLVAYWIALLATGIGGILLLRDLFRKRS